MRSHCSSANLPSCSGSSSRARSTSRWRRRTNALVQVAVRRFGRRSHKLGDKIGLADDVSPNDRRKQNGADLWTNDIRAQKSTPLPRNLCFLIAANNHPNRRVSTKHHGKIHKGSIRQNGKFLGSTCPVW